MADESDGFSKHYTDDGFWAKVGRVAKAVGREGITLTLTLYFAMQDPEVPAWAKGVIVAALGYFIFPIDVIPDVLVPVGYTDDVAVMTAALTAVAVHVTPETKAKAADKVGEWFGVK